MRFLLRLQWVCATSISIPSTPMGGGGNLPMMILGDGVSWGRPSNFTEWISMIGKGAGIDSAWDYGQFGGSPPTAANGSEARIPGQIVAAGAKREDVFITSKLPCSGFDGGSEPMSETMAQQYIESNLKMLQSTYVDLLLLHHVCRTSEETAMVWHVMEAAKKAGKAKAIGVSNFVVEDLIALHDHGNITEPIAANQCQFTVGKIDNATIRWCQEHSVAVSSYGTLHGPVGMDHPAISAVAARHNVSTAVVMLKYVSQQGIAIVTASDREQYDKGDASIFEWTLTPSDMQELDAVQGGQQLSCSDCYALPCRTCQDQIKAAGCQSFIDHYDHSGCMTCVKNLNASAMVKVKAVCSDDFIFKACW